MNFKIDTYQDKGNPGTERERCKIKVKLILCIRFQRLIYYMNKTPREKLFTKGSCLPLACLPTPNDFVVHKTMTSRNVKVVLQGRTSVPDFQDPRCINFNLQLLQKKKIIIILISVLPTQFQQNSALNSMCRRKKTWFTCGPEVMPL